MFLNMLLLIRWCSCVQCLCATRVFEVQASSSSRRQPLCRVSFLSQPPLLS